MTDSEKKILAKLKRWLGINTKRYTFWFVYVDEVAVNWEGGMEDFPPTLQTPQFRNQYTITPFSLYNNRKTIKNW